MQTNDARLQNAAGKEVAERNSRANIKTRHEEPALGREEAAPLRVCGPSEKEKKTDSVRPKGARVGIKDFVSLKVIGCGAFGEVRLVKMRNTKNKYAMKIIPKADTFRKKMVAYVRAERDVLVEADHRWVVKIYYSFQDFLNLYLVMEFLSGGDMLSLISKKNTLDEECVQFYIAEIALAIDSVHRLGFMHRDIKPENVLLDARGHIKLADFGLCTSTKNSHCTNVYRKHSHAKPSNFYGEKSWPVKNDEQLTESCYGENRKLFYSRVGTPAYTAPEIVLKMGYGPEIDWWSLGIVMYKMLFGYTPWRGKTTEETFEKIKSWQTFFVFPVDESVSDKAREVISGFCTHPGDRLGSRNGVEDVKSLPFFHGVDWSRIREGPAPIPVCVRSSDDTSNFADFHNVNLVQPAVPLPWEGCIAYRKWMFKNYSFQRPESPTSEGASSNN